MPEMVARLLSRLAVGGRLIFRFRAEANLREYAGLTEIRVAALIHDDCNPPTRYSAAILLAWQHDLAPPSAAAMPADNRANRRSAANRLAPFPTRRKSPGAFSQSSRSSIASRKSSRCNSRGMASKRS